MEAAWKDHPAIVGKLVDARADVNTKENDFGCAFAGGPSGGGRSAAADCACAVRQGHSAALGGALGLHQIRRGAARRRRRPDHHEQLRVTLRRPQRRRTGRAPNRPESAQANASPMGTRERQARRVRRGGGGGAAAARRPPPGLRHAAPRTGAAVHAQTAVFGVRRRTRGMVCASHCAQSVAVVGRQRVGREHTKLPLTVRGARSMPRSQTRGSRRTASLALRALRRQSSLTVAQAKQLIQAKAEVRSRRLCPVAPVRAPTSVVA